MYLYIGPYKRKLVGGLGYIYDIPDGCIGAIDIGSNEDQRSQLEYRKNGLFLTRCKLPSEYDLICIGNPRECKKSKYLHTCGDNVAQQITKLMTDGDPSGDLTVKPLMPSNGYLNINLGPFNIYKSRFQYGKHKHTNQVKSIVNIDLNKSESQSRICHIFDYWCASLQISDSTQLNKYLIRKPHNTSYNDNFNGHGFNAPFTTFGWTDVGLGTLFTDGGSLGGNTGYVGSGGVQTMRYTSAMDGANQKGWLYSVAAFQAGESCAVTLRMASDGSAYYMSWQSWLSGQTYTTLYKWTGSSHTALSTTNVVSGLQAPSFGSVNGSTFDGGYGTTSPTILHSVTDTSIVSNSYAGLAVYWGGLGGACYFDDWHVEDIITTSIFPHLNHTMSGNFQTQGY